MTTHNEDALPIVVPADPPAGALTSTVTLTQHMLGLEPYLLIRVEMIPEDERDDEADDGLRLKVETGGGAEGPDLAALYLLNVPAEHNPLTAAIAQVIAANPGVDELPEALAMFAEHCDIPMPEARR